MTTPVAFSAVPAEFQTIVRWVEAVDCPTEDEETWTDPDLGTSGGKSLQMQKTADNYCGVLQVRDQVMQSAMTEMCNEIGCISKSFYRMLYSGIEQQARYMEYTGSGKHKISHTVISYDVSFKTNRVTSVRWAEAGFGGFFFHKSIVDVVIDVFCEQTKNHSAVRNYVKKQGEVAENVLQNSLLLQLRQLVVTYL